MRLSSVEPMDFSDDLLGLMASSARIAKHVHAPLQSGSDRVLRRMHRKYRPRHYAERIQKARALMPDLGKLIEYNTSCSPVFVQRAGVVAIRDGEPTVLHTLERFRAARDFLVGKLARLGAVHAALPPGAMYVFFRVGGMTDSLEFCKRLVREARLGLAPGSAFGPEGEGFVRWCFAAGQDRLAEGVRRLETFLGR